MNFLKRVAPSFILSVIVLLSTASAFDFDYSCTKTFDDYYFGGEYLYFTCTITPDSSSDAKQADDLTYTLLTNLDSSAISVIVEYKDGKKAIHPSPDDVYTIKNGTYLEFFIPETDDGVEEIQITVSGFIPVIKKRLENISALAVNANDEELIELEIVVVNKQKFYSDLKDFEEERCADEKKLTEAKSFYNDKKYSKAEEILAEIEEAINKCLYESEKEKYEEQVDQLKSQLYEITSGLAFIQYRLEFDRDKIKNYDEVMEKWKNLTLQRDSLDKELDEVQKLISKGDFKVADEKIDSLSDQLTSVKAQVEALKTSIKEEEAMNFDIMTIAAIAGGGILALVVIAMVLNSRKKDKW